MNDPTPRPDDRVLDIDPQLFQRRLTITTFSLLTVVLAIYLLREFAVILQPLFVAVFFVYLIPPSLLFLSLSRLVVWLGLQDSTWSLVLIYPTITVPVSTWLLIGFLKALPKDVEEQAMIDGYSRAGAFVRIVVPLLFPGIVAVVVFLGLLLLLLLLPPRPQVELLIPGCPVSAPL